MVVKVAEVRISKKGTVQIKTNKGPNWVLTGEKALSFISIRDNFVDTGIDISKANSIVAEDYIRIIGGN